MPSELQGIYIMVDFMFVMGRISLALYNKGGVLIIIIPPGVYIATTLTGHMIALCHNSIKPILIPIEPLPACSINSKCLNLFSRCH